jgi:NTE family protein
MSAFQPPDVLVLGAGGVVGEAWMTGVLAGIEETTGIDFRATEHFVGTSAGSLVAANLAAGRAPRRPDTDDGSPIDHGLIDEDGSISSLDAGADPPAGDDDGNERSRLAGLAATATQWATTWGVAAATPLTPFALSATRPAGALIRAALLARMPEPTATLDGVGRRIARARLTFDGRLRVVALDRVGGRRVVFGAPGAPLASVADAVQASCSVPWLYRPVEIEGRDYVDGGVWSPTNLDVAPALRDTHVLCLTPTGGPAPDGNGPGITALRAASRAATAVEDLVLRRRGAIVRIIAPDAAAAPTVARALDGARGDTQPALAAGFRQGCELGLGGDQA